MGKPDKFNDPAFQEWASGISASAAGLSAWAKDEKAKLTKTAEKRGDTHHLAERATITTTATFGVLEEGSEPAVATFLYDDESHTVLLDDMVDIDDKRSFVSMYSKAVKQELEVARASKSDAIERGDDSNSALWNVAEERLEADGAWAKFASASLNQGSASSMISVRDNGVVLSISAVVALGSLLLACLL